MNNKVDNKNWDWEERTAKFGENIILFCKKIPKNTITIPSLERYRNIDGFCDLCFI